jgi:hypothetical protein
VTATDDLISRLAADLRPVRRLAPPMWRAAGWLAFAALLIAAAVAVFGLRPDIAERLRDMGEMVQWLASAATGVLAAVAAFQLSLPDRSPRWILLPLPAAAIWVGTLGLGCLAEVLKIGPAALSPGLSPGCMAFILGLGLPLAGSLVWMLRYAVAIRPVPVAAMGGLAGASLSAAGLWLFHELEGAAEALVWHAGMTLVVVAILLAFGRSWERREAARGFTGA